MKARIVMMVLLSLIVSGCASVRQEQTATATIPAAAIDPFVGRWTEYWPGIPEHATHTIVKRDGAYQIQGASPLTQQYGISDVRMDGDVLKFSEGNATFVVEYEMQVKDHDTLSVRAKGRSGWRNDIAWSRSR